jgi:hypothetical protein
MEMEMEMSLVSRSIAITSLFSHSAQLECSSKSIVEREP